MSEQEQRGVGPGPGRVDVERLHRLARHVSPHYRPLLYGHELEALLAVVDAARGPARFITALRDALEPFTPAEEGRLAEARASKRRAEQRSTWGGREEPERAESPFDVPTASSNLVFNERMQERERQRRLADLGIEVVDPPVSDAVSSDTGGRPVSHPGAENGPQILSRPASLEHQIADLMGREQELYSRGRRLERERDDVLSSLEVARAQERKAWDTADAAEARLARVPALVEAARQHRCRKLVKHAGDIGTCPYCETLAEWEQA